eukprot:746663-Amphidinium_carterae.1
MRFLDRFTPLFPIFSLFLGGGSQDWVTNGTKVPEFLAPDCCSHVSETACAPAKICKLRSRTSTPMEIESNPHHPPKLFPSR